MLPQCYQNCTKPLAITILTQFYLLQTKTERAEMPPLTSPLNQYLLNKHKCGVSQNELKLTLHLYLLLFSLIRNYELQPSLQIVATLHLCSH